MAICTPPTVRHHLAVAAIEYGLHVLLKKPPAATMSQADSRLALLEVPSTFRRIANTCAYTPASPT